MKKTLQSIYFEIFWNIIFQSFRFKKGLWCVKQNNICWKILIHQQLFFLFQTKVVKIWKEKSNNTVDTITIKIWSEELFFINFRDTSHLQVSNSLKLQQKSSFVMFWSQSYIINFAYKKIELFSDLWFNFCWTIRYNL